MRLERNGPAPTAARHGGRPRAGRRRGLVQTLDPNKPPMVVQPPERTMANSCEKGERDGGSDGGERTLLVNPEETEGQAAIAGRERRRWRRVVECLLVWSRAAGVPRI